MHGKFHELWFQYFFQIKFQLHSILYLMFNGTVVLKNLKLKLMSPNNGLKSE